MVMLNWNHKPLFVQHLVLHATRPTSVMPLDHSGDGPLAVDTMANSSSTAASVILSPFQHNGLDKTANVYWWAASGLAVWFLLIHTPPLLIQRHVWKFQDPLLILHLMGAGGVYLACIHNALLNPSTFAGRSKSWHVNVGRLGLLLGTVGALSGAVLTWTRLDQVELGFAIGISIGGVFQLLAQWRGYHYIRNYQRVVDELQKLDYTTMTSPHDSTSQQQQQ